MKKILVLLTVMAATLFISCEAGDDEAPAAGNGTVEIKVTYTGAETKAASPGNYRIYAILLNETEIADYRPPQTLTPAYYACTADNAVEDSEYTLTITNVPAGEYYVLFVYDLYSQESKIAGTNDIYALYDNVTTVTSCNEDADTITVTGDATTQLNSISFSNVYVLQGTHDGTSSGGSYIECSAK